MARSGDDQGHSAGGTIAYADENFLVLDDGQRIGPFSSHWAACAAMIRRHDPGFTSTGGDKPEDLHIERHALARAKGGR
jgi:hypothetical protein